MNYKFFCKNLNEIIYNKSYTNNIKIKKWNHLKKKINNSKSHPVTIQRVLNIVEKFLSNKKNIRILDHGCGGCFTIFYLHALNFQNLIGIDVGGEQKEINNFFYLISKKKNNKKIIYNGKKIPLKNKYFDFIFSQQVLEHIPFDKFKDFIKEEKRVLKSNGIVYHQIPHKLVPYESHLRIWFLHWLPKNIFAHLCKLLGKNYIFIKKHLWLQFPWIYYFYLNKYIGTTSNLSFQRIKLFNNENLELSGIGFFIRKFASIIWKIPIIGNILSKLISHFIMLETISFNNQNYKVIK